MYLGENNHEEIGTKCNSIAEWLKCGNKIVTELTAFG